MSIPPVPPTELASLVDRVLEDHDELRQALDVAARLARLQGEDVMEAAIELLSSELEDHMLKEERVLLPWIRSGRGGTAGAPIRAMTAEHVHTLERVTHLRELTGGYRAPHANLGPLYLRLHGLDRFLRAHIAFEDEVLFPRALRGGGAEI